MFLCIGLKGVILYCTGGKTYIILEGIALLDTRRCWPYIMLESVGLILNDIRGPIMKQLLDAKLP